MQQSADSLRERRRAETGHALIRDARRRTAEMGLHGFTVEEVCEAAGVSRRTFFNYFASKEDAVLGVTLLRNDEAAVAAFLAGGDPESPDLSATLLDDLATLSIERWSVMDLAPDTFAELLAAVDREPRLLPRLLDHGAAIERADASLIEQREGLPEGDLRASIAAQVVGTIGRSTVHAFLNGGHDRPFADLYRTHLDAARQLLRSQNLLPEGPA
ncbi:TetR/AcrR family transcriptional regulator [Microbacterium sp. cx-55]|uniref:TetR/AcrR family transcriptional regulator n=1 Tax=unclassified Microbacterium TaxID=2609290 RepID=UPI001CBBF90C|nr:MULTISPECIES: TetR/AcrR family transcriptional regulator [unclassified Microbacterium]MBZ4487784.1 TetR/AcrR family transcriptional regulator [Microbacterium sp. cx-55]MCC4909190.1 TetR/AcrR family transcriptional regulator [Microbacterium sp. cx-59]UGB34804.1 TetR/AcrR family transcriptional regulator [Microbacterium sp. cx-55]